MIKPLKFHFYLSKMLLKKTLVGFPNSCAVSSANLRYSNPLPRVGQKCLEKLQLFQLFLLVHGSIFHVCIQKPEFVTKFLRWDLQVATCCVVHSYIMVDDAYSIALGLKKK